VPQIWTVDTHSGWPSFVTALNDPINGVGWSPDGQWLAFSLAPGDRKLELLELAVIRDQEPLDPLRFVLIAGAGWMNQWEYQMMDYLREENRVLREQLGERRLWFNDDQRRRLAVKAKGLTRWLLDEMSPVPSQNVVGLERL
jgi:hypothetical protein